MENYYFSEFWYLRVQIFLNCNLYLNKISLPCKVCIQTLDQLSGFNRPDIKLLSEKKIFEFCTKIFQFVITKFKRLYIRGSQLLSIHVPPSLKEKNSRTPNEFLAGIFHRKPYSDENLTFSLGFLTYRGLGTAALYQSNLTQYSSPDSGDGILMMGGENTGVRLVPLCRDVPDPCQSILKKKK
jgi:hypothetical protein